MGGNEEPPTQEGPEVAASTSSMAHSTKPAPGLDSLPPMGGSVMARRWPPRWRHTRKETHSPTPWFHSESGHVMEASGPESSPCQPPILLQTHYVPGPVLAPPSRNPSSP